MTPEAEALAKELKRMHLEPPFETLPKTTWVSMISAWVLTALTTLILMSIGGAITVAALAHYGWIQFASL